MRVTSLFIVASLLACVSSRSIDDPKNIENFIRKSVDDSFDGDHFEGDIRVLDHETGIVGILNLMGGGGTGLVDEQYRWPKSESGHVIVPYEIDAAQNYTDDEVVNIKTAMSWVEKDTCVQFKEHKDEENFLFITIETGDCSSYVGMAGAADPEKKKQPVNFAHKCTNVRRIGAMAHEMIHALGFWHAQSHTDRDDFVKVNYENVMEGREINFDMLSENVVTNFGTPYDYFSIMHYPPLAFTVNGEPTIEALIEPEKYNMIMGQRNVLSPGDIERINRMYECEKRIDDDVIDDVIDNEIDHKKDYGIDY
jgi:hypothetical protein